MTATVNKFGKLVAERAGQVTVRIYSWDDALPVAAGPGRPEYSRGKFRDQVEVDPKPFRHPMMMNLVCETYAWEQVPTDEELADNERNTAYFDYVRTFRLVKDKSPDLSRTR
jgi:hypothetical protein